MEPGRRERKKAATRAHIADTALALFLDKGYENVTVRDVAAAADVSPTTLLNHFPTKEALVVDLGDEIAADLTRAVAGHGPDLLDTLRRYARDRVARAAGDPDSQRYLALVFGNRDLAEYWRQTWVRHGSVLATASREEIGAAADDPRPAVTAHFVLEAIVFAIRAADPSRVLDAAFDVIVGGTSLRATS